MYSWSIMFSRLSNFILYMYVHNCTVLFAFFNCQGHIYLLMVDYSCCSVFNFSLFYIFVNYICSCLLVDVIIQYSCFSNVNKAHNLSLCNRLVVHS